MDSSHHRLPQGDDEVGELDEEDLVAGQCVRVYYHANTHPEGFRYVRTGEPKFVDPEIDDAFQANSPDTRTDPEADYNEGPVVGVSTGWIPATVAEDYNPQWTDEVLVWLHGCFADAYHPDPPESRPSAGMYWKVHRKMIRPISVEHPPVELSMLIVRWWDYRKKGRSMNSHNITHEDVLQGILEGQGSPHSVFGCDGNYEVCTAFVRSTTDLRQLEEEALVQRMRGHRRVAMYFLWPTQRQEYESRKPGYVAESDLLRVMSSCEAHGIATIWPHPAPLYRELAGKRWAPRVTADQHWAPQLRVPPTVVVEHEQWQEDPWMAAKLAIQELRRLKADVHRGDALDLDDYRGVAKLAFSWMGEHVRPFTGISGLARALTDLLKDVSSEGRCLVQERIEDVVCEFRVVCCRDLASSADAANMELVRMRLRPPGRHADDESFCLTSGNAMMPSEAAAHAFAGNASNMQQAEEAALQLARRWLAWLQAEGFGIPANCRFDFLVASGEAAAARRSRNAAQRSSRSCSESPVEVWTVELSECGASMCGLDHEARTVALTNECLASSSSRRPLPLPPFCISHAGVSDSLNSSTAVGAVPTPVRGAAAGARAGHRHDPLDTSLPLEASRKRLAQAVPGHPGYRAMAVLSAALTVTLSSLLVAQPHRFQMASARIRAIFLALLRSLVQKMPVLRHVLKIGMGLPVTS